jgi:hypothetical protein
MMRMTAETERYLELMQSPAMSAMEQARRMGLLEPSWEQHKALTTALDATKIVETYRLPERHEIALLAHEAVSGSSLTALFGRDHHVLAVEQAMRAMRTSWLNTEHLNSSARAFAELQAMGYALNERLPFDTTLAASLRPSLGDWRDLMTIPARDLLDPLARSAFYLERGFDPALTAFTASAFRESVGIAGLREYEPAETVDDGEVDEEWLARNREAFGLLQRFEVAIRRFISEAMHSAYGDQWMKRQLPSAMSERWLGKRDITVKAGGAECPLIEYADLTDYWIIIGRGDNWSQVFRPIFGRMEDVRESFQRLFPIRNAIVHTRVVTLDDELLLLVETKRILRAVGRRS